MTSAIVRNLSRICKQLECRLGRGAGAVLGRVLSGVAPPAGGFGGITSENFLAPVLALDGPVSMTAGSFRILTMGQWTAGGAKTISGERSLFPDETFSR
jgi:hypothetical protein